MKIKAVMLVEFTYTIFIFFEQIASAKLVKKLKINFPKFCIIRCS